MWDDVIVSKGILSELTPAYMSEGISTFTTTHKAGHERLLSPVFGRPSMEDHSYPGSLNPRIDFPLKFLAVSIALFMHRRGLVSSDMS